MGASTVTGAGLGSSMDTGGVKGPGNLRNQFVPLASPRVVASGAFTIGGTLPTFTVPSTSSAGDFYVFAQDTSAATYTVAAVRAWVTVSSTTATVNITGTGTDKTNYVVVTNSLIW